MRNQMTKNQDKAVHPVYTLDLSTYDETKGRGTLTIARKGFTEDEQYFLTEQALKDSVGMFKDLKMFLNHPTSAERWDLGTRDINNYAAHLISSSYDDKKGLLGEYAVVNPGLKAQLDMMKAQGLLDKMEISMRADGTGPALKHADGRTYKKIDKIEKAHSVDFVSYANAGGKVTMLHSHREQNQRGQESNMDQELKDALAKIAGLELAAKNLQGEFDALKTKHADTLTLSKTLQEKVTALENDKAVVVELAKSGLPEASQKRVAKQLNLAFRGEKLEPKQIEEAVDDEKDYLESIGVDVEKMEQSDRSSSRREDRSETRTRSGSRRDRHESMLELGKSQGGKNSRKDAGEEEAGKKLELSFKADYKRMGYNEKEAERFAKEAVSAAR